MYLKNHHKSSNDDRQCQSTAAVWESPDQQNKNIKQHMGYFSLSTQRKHILRNDRKCIELKKKLHQ